MHHARVTRADSAAAEKRPDDGLLAQGWAEHLRAPFPGRFRGTDIDAFDLVLLDSGAAGLVQRELAGGLHSDGLAMLWAVIADLDKVVPAISDAYCAGYYARLRVIAGLAAARHTPAAI